MQLMAVMLILVQLCAHLSGCHVNDLSVYCIRNFSGYIKMKERSEKLAYDV